MININLKLYEHQELLAQWVLNQYVCVVVYNREFNLLYSIGLLSTCLLL